VEAPVADGSLHLQPRRRVAHPDIARWALEQGVGSATELWRWCDRPAWLMHLCAGAMPFADAAIGLCSVAHVVEGFTSPLALVGVPDPKDRRYRTETGWVHDGTSDPREAPALAAKMHESLWFAARRRAGEAARAFDQAAAQAYVVTAAVTWQAAEERLYSLAHALAQGGDLEEADLDLMRIGQATRDQRDELCNAIRSSPFFAEEVVIEGLLRADLQVLEGYRPRWRRQ
jgi:hypothetical protein